MLHELAVQPGVVVCGRVHTVPHIPQLAGSMAVFAQYDPEAPVQVARGDAQVAPQVPVEHTCPAGQAWPHTPQLRLSVCTFTQAPAHVVCPMAHETTHIPPEHTLPAGHALPHEPQLALSLWRLEHAPAQVV